MNKTRSNTVAVCVWLLGLAVTAHAKPGAQLLEQTRFGSLTILQSSVSLDQAVAMVQAKYGAKSVRAITIDVNGRPVHEIRLRSADGSRVWTVQVDVTSGREF
jgi:uncharacterized membrane protein YkoI